MSKLDRIDQETVESGPDEGVDPVADIILPEAIPVEEIRYVPSIIMLAMESLPLKFRRKV